MVLLTEETILDQLKEYNINLLRFPPDETEHTFDIKNFKFFEDLGRGSFGVVKKCIFEPIGKVLAAKFVPFYQNRHEDNAGKLADQKEQFKLHKEISEPDHKNIIDIYGYGYVDNTFIIFMESMDYSLLEFYQMVKNSGKQFPENLIGCIAVAVINGLVHCAEKQIIHRDLKPGNILINYHQGSIKLCDFGASKIMVEDVASTYVGTIAYWPPERFDSKLVINEEGKAIRPIYDIRADIWSLGITLAEVVKGQLPYEFKNDGGLDLKEDRMALHKIITEVTSEEILESCFKDREGYTQELRIFLQACLNKVEFRPKYDELMDMAFYQEYRIFNESKISLFIVNTIPENEINHLKELVKKNNLARMTKDISTNAYPTTTNFENSELIDEGIVASDDPVDNCFKAIFGREEFDDTISLAPTPYSKIPLETKNSLDKGKLIITPVSYDSGISDSFGSFKNKAVASEIDKNEAEMALAKVKIGLAKEKIKLTEAERKEVKRQKTNSLVSKNSGETVTNFHVALDLANLVQGSINSNNASPISEITASNQVDEKLISKQEQSSTSTLNTTTHAYKNWPYAQENLENTDKKDVEQIKDLQQQENMYIPPFPVLPDLSTPPKMPIDSINPNRNYKSVASEMSEPNLIKDRLEAQDLKYPIAPTNATPLEEVQPLNLTGTLNYSTKDTFHSSSPASINPLQASLDSNHTELLQSPTNLELIEKIKQPQQTLKENYTKRNLDEIHTGPKSKNTSNKKRHIVEVIHEHQNDIKQRQKNPESFQTQSRKANEKNKQQKLEGPENPRQESQNTKSINMQEEDLASYTAIKIDSTVEPAVVQEDQSSNSTSVSIQAIEELIENENYNIDQPRNHILPQEEIDTSEWIQRLVTKENQVLTNKAASKEYEPQHEYIEDVSLLPIPNSTAESNLENFISSQNETIKQLFQEIKTYHKAQTDFHKIQTDLAILQKEKTRMELENLKNQKSHTIEIDHKAQTDFHKIQIELAILQKEKIRMELENLKNQKCHTIEIDHKDEHKTVQNKSPVEPVLCCLDRESGNILIVMGSLCLFSLVAIAALCFALFSNLR